MRYFPWQTVGLLGLTTYLLLLLVGGLWWRALESALAAGLHLSGGPDWEAAINFGRWSPWRTLGGCRGDPRRGALHPLALDGSTKSTLGEV